MNAYATVTELADWLGADAPPETARLLVRASTLIDTIVVASFDVDANGKPTDADVCATLRDAACAQVEFWLEVGADHGVRGPVAGTVTVGDVSWPDPPRTVAPQAAQRLRAGRLGP